MGAAPATVGIDHPGPVRRERSPMGVLTQPRPRPIISENVEARPPALDAHGHEQAGPILRPSNRIAVATSIQVDLTEWACMERTERDDLARIRWIDGQKILSGTEGDPAVHVLERAG